MTTTEVRALIRELSPKKVYFYTTFADPDYYNWRTVRWSAGRTFADDCIEIEEGTKGGRRTRSLHPSEMEDIENATWRYDAENILAMLDEEKKSLLARLKMVNKWIKKVKEDQ